MAAQNTAPPTFFDGSTPAPSTFTIPTYTPQELPQEPTTVPVTMTEQTATMPAKAHELDAGYDLFSNEYMTVRAGGFAAVKTHVKAAIPAGHVGLVCSRSGLAFKHGIGVLNAPGVIDAGYRGEMSVCLFNTSTVAYKVSPGDRIAQLLVVKLADVELEQVDELPPAEDSRGENGYGSTGK